MKNQQDRIRQSQPVVQQTSLQNRYTNTNYNTSEVQNNNQKLGMQRNQAIQAVTRPQKADFWQPRTATKQPNQDKSIMMVPCINCEDLVAMDMIDKHSLKCCTVSKRVMAVGKSPQLFDEIDFKITKLKESLKLLIDQIKKKELPQQGSNNQANQKLKYLCRACEIADAVIVVQNLGNIEERKLRDMEEELKILNDGYKGSLGVALYMERLHSLILQKLSVFVRQQSNQKSGRDRITSSLQKNTQDTQNRRMQPQMSSDNFFTNKNGDNRMNETQEQRNNSKNSISKHSVGSSQTTTKDQIKNLINEKNQEATQMKNQAQVYQQKTLNSQQMINNFMQINIQKNQSVTPYSTVKQDQFQSPLHPNFEQNASRYLSPDLPNGRPTLITKFSGSQDRSQQQDHNQKSEILTQISSSQWDQEAGLLEDHQGISQFQSSGDQLQRIFYSKCLNLKMRLASNHPAQKIPVSVLFKEAQSKQISQSQWEQFIQSALQSPYEYLDMNKIANYNNSKIVRNNLKEKMQDQLFKTRLQHL